MEGIYLAISVIAIYSIFGPLVLIGLYVLFDKFIERNPVFEEEKKNPDPYLLTEADIKRILRKKRRNERILKKV